MDSYLFSMTDSAVLCTRARIDPRGPRFGGAISTVVLAIALIAIGTPLGAALIAWQTLVFGLGAFAGLRAQPYGILFRTFISPRLPAPAELEDSAPPRFAQLVGFAFLAVALLSVLLGSVLISAIAVAFALGAAFLNAAFNFCLGCEVFLLVKRLARSS
ncbi:membrane protein [Actinomycetes bacterium]|nr:membrane protein [Actinomycetes bacterium]